MNDTRDRWMDRVNKCGEKSDDASMQVGQGIEGIMKMQWKILALKLNQGKKM